MLDALLIGIGAVLILLGAVGCIAPIIPGPPLSWIGLLILKFVPNVKDDISWTTIILLGIFTILITILDNVLPVWSTKKMGGNKKVVWGATIGMLVGFFFGIIGIIIGPFIGAFLGGLLSGSAFFASIKHASGAFVGFLCGLIAKLICVALIAFFFVMAIV